MKNKESIEALWIKFRKEPEMEIILTEKNKPQEVAINIKQQSTSKKLSLWQRIFCCGIKKEKKFSLKTSNKSAELNSKNLK